MATSRERLIVEAERLFAEVGIDGVSLREISAAAEVANNNAVQYHFGSKAGLIEAVLSYRLIRVNNSRSALLAAADAGGRGRDLRALLEAWLLPFSEELADPGSRYLSVLAQLLHYLEAPAHPFAEAHRRAMEKSRPGGFEVGDRLRRELGHGDLPAAVVSQRTRAIGTLFTHTLADRERAECEDPSGKRVSRRLLIADLLDSGMALLTAAPSDATLAALGRTDDDDAVPTSNDEPPIPAETAKLPRNSGRRRSLPDAKRAPARIPSSGDRT